MIFLIAICVFLSACLSASETALFSLSRTTIESYALGNQRQKLTARLMERPRDVLVTILMLNILANILVQNSVSSLFSEENGLIYKVGLPLAITLIFGEILPKTLAMPHATKIAVKVAPWIDRAARVFRPIRAPLVRITSWLSRAIFFFLREEKEISPDELRHVLKTGEECGILIPAEAELISGSIDLVGSQVKEHMRPRDEILYFDLGDPYPELLRLFTEKETSRVLVSEGGLQNLRGILTARDFFFRQGQIREVHDLLPFLKKPYYVPESVRAMTLLRTLRARREKLAVVVDEYGSITGLISQEDLVEKVIGDLAGKRGEKQLYTRSSEDVIIASGKLDLSEFKDIFGIELEPTENIVTLGGWLVEQLGDIPQAGTKYATDRFLFYILAAEPNRIRRIYVRKLIR